MSKLKKTNIHIPLSNINNLQKRPLCRLKIHLSRTLLFLRFPTIFHSTLFCNFLPILRCDFQATCSLFLPKNLLPLTRSFVRQYFANFPKVGKFCNFHRFLSSPIRPVLSQQNHRPLPCILYSSPKTESRSLYAGLNILKF